MQRSIMRQGASHIHGNLARASKHPGREDATGEVSLCCDMSKMAIVTDLLHLDRILANQDNVVQILVTYVGRANEFEDWAGKQCSGEYAKLRSSLSRWLGDGVGHFAVGLSRLCQYLIRVDRSRYPLVVDEDVVLYLVIHVWKQAAQSEQRLRANHGCLKSARESRTENGKKVYHGGA